jgi:uncharacterized membrane protein YfcA
MTKPTDLRRWQRSAREFDNDMTPTDFALAGVIFFAAHVVSAATGFGSGVLGLPLLTLVVGLEPAKQSLLVLGILLYAYMSIRWRRHIDRRQLLIIMAVTSVGLVIGMLAAARLNPRISTALLAAFVILVGLRELFGVASDVRAPRWLRQLMLLLGGVVHGAFTTGGPVLIVYCHHALPDKSAFRATLAAMWFLLGIGLAVGWTLGDLWQPSTVRLSLLGLPFMIAGLLVGEFLHHRIDQKHFRSAVNLALIAIGIVLALAAFK